MKSPSRLFAALAVALVLAGPARAADAETFELVIKDHRFIPDRIEVPAEKKVTLLVRNLDASPEEFESYDLKREKVVKGGQEIRVIVGPLSPGEYKFVGEYHEDTAKGVLVAR